jgi:hypothetical protein
MSFSRRVSVLSHDCARVVCFIHWDRIQVMIDQGVVKAEGKNKAGQVNSVRLMQDHKLRCDARPGSFSIRREHFEIGKDYGLSGGMVFSHQPNLYDRVAA